MRWNPACCFSRALWEQLANYPTADGRNPNFVHPQQRMAWLLAGRLHITLKSRADLDRGTLLGIFPKQASSPETWELSWQVHPAV